MNNNNPADPIDLIAVLWKWRKHTFVVTALAVIVSSTASYMIQELFESKVIVYPTKTNVSLLKHNLLPMQTNSLFGEDEEAEHMVQILQSTEIRNAVIDKFHLYEHYGIDSTDLIARDEMIEVFNGMIGFRRTRFGSIEIKAFSSSFLIISVIESCSSEMLGEA